MLYSFFDDRGELRIDPYLKQVDVALQSQAAGIAILGLATEVSKLSAEERSVALSEVAHRIDGKKPLLVTVFGNTPSEQIAFASKSVEAGASALILQPPVEKLDDVSLRNFFAEVISEVDCTIGIQNAPEFIGFGLSNQSLITLASEHKNFRIAKLECTAVALDVVASELPDTVMVFNGRCALELTDNLHAGAQGVIPGIELVDKTSEIYRLHTAGDVEAAEQVYTSVLPVISSIMQGLPHLLAYGKFLASLRLGIDPGGRRGDVPDLTEFGAARIRRFAHQLGSLQV